MINKNSFAVMSVLAFLLLAGCGNNAKADTTSAVEEQANNDGAAQGQGSGQGGLPMQSADLLGKVKSINGQTITVYKSSFVPGERGGNRNVDGQQQVPNTDQNGDSQQPPSGNATGDGQQPPDGNGDGQAQGRPNMGNMFSDETVDIIVTNSTKLVKTTFENNQMTENTLTLGDLKEGDILNIDLEENTQNAITLTLSEGGFGGMGMGGGRQGQVPGSGPGQGQQETPAAQ